MNKHMHVALRLALLLVMVASLGVVSTDASAHDRGGDKPQVKVIASGLDNPRGMSFGPDGALYVAEAGRGGDNCIEIGTEEEPQQVCLGLTGAVTRIYRGRQMRVKEGLPSLAGAVEGNSATGPQDVVYTSQGLRVVIGLGGNPENRSLFPKEFQSLGKLIQLNRWRGAKTVVDVAGYELRNNPEPTAVDSNPYALLERGSKFIVADAGGNSLLEISKNGKIKTLAIFPPHLVDTPPDLPFPLPPQIPMEAVPNSVVVGPDGAYYVGQLGGFPFLPGESNVFRVRPGRDVEVFQSGFTSIIDIAFDRRGNLYVLEIAKNGLLAAEMGGDFSGALIKVSKDGTRTTVLEEGLVAPTGMVIDKEGNIYVANQGVFAGQGEILRIRP
jgi:hypothetical protein